MDRDVSRTWISPLNKRVYVRTASNPAASARVVSFAAASATPFRSETLLALRLYLGFVLDDGGHIGKTVSAIRSVKTLLLSAT